ncbi:MAG: hypothetical protein QOD75_2848 [Blastocatellia bacterium]|nr:hypothetical protein [Blastocatellia bacterium]
MPKTISNHSSPFYLALHEALHQRRTTLAEICPPADQVARRMLEDYGAMFLASPEVVPPPTCIFSNEDEVQQFQKAAGFSAASIDGARVELQPAAMKGLEQARRQAHDEGLDITPRDGAEAARRSYTDSLRLWNTRFVPALAHWEKQGRLSAEQVDWLQNLSIDQQVRAVLELEQDGIFFSKDLSKSVLYSIAAPGTSQHVAMLAFDVIEFHHARVRQIMSEHGWFQTVLSDLPHFTFLGLRESDLAERGLKRVEVDGQAFWIPNV